MKSGFSRLKEVAESALAAEEEAEGEKLLAEHHVNPVSALPLAEMNTRLRSRFAPGCGRNQVF